jgi:molybdopterin molybdotransferase
MIPISQAISIIKREIMPQGSEECEISAVCGRILAEDIYADSDLPPFDRSMMDGFAVKCADTKDAPVKLKIMGESIAGKRWDGELKAGEAIRIMTGAAMPIGADSVQRVELTRELDGFIEILESTKVGQNFSLQANEITNGTTVFASGEQITDKMIASLASFGYSNVKVAKRPTVSILATGNELVGISEIPNRDQIRDSNSMMLKIFAEKFADVNILPKSVDDLESLKSQIENQRSQILILTGGVSMGDYDFTKPALRELGAEIFFERVSLRPGKPTVFAKLGDTFIFGLPGNPVSVAVTFYLFIRTVLLLMQNAADIELKSGFALISKPVKGAVERDSYLPAQTSTNEKGRLIVEPLRWSGSSDFVSFSRADCLIVVPKGELFAAESVVKIVFI